MKKLLIFITVLSAVCFSSCFGDGWSVGPSESGGQELINVTFNKVDLKFDFNKIIQTNFNNIPNYIHNDYNEFCFAHSIFFDNTYSGSITDLTKILWLEEQFGDERKPSITYSIESRFGEITTFKCTKENIGWNFVLGIPYVNNILKATMEIKSVKTQEKGLQVIWTKTAFSDNWPINEFVEDGKIACNETSIITKVGTNNKNGNVAARGQNIISNTSDIQITDDYGIRFVKDENQLTSPNLSKPVLSGGKASGGKWSKATIYKAM